MESCRHQNLVRRSSRSLRAFTQKYDFSSLQQEIVLLGGLLFLGVPFAAHGGQALKVRFDWDLHPSGSTHELAAQHLAPVVRAALAQRK